MRQDVRLEAPGGRPAAGGGQHGPGHEGEAPHQEPGSAHAPLAEAPLRLEERLVRVRGPKDGRPIRDILLKGESDWEYTGKYWEARERGDFDHRPDIFFMPEDFDK